MTLTTSDDFVSYERGSPRVRLLFSSWKQWWQDDLRERFDFFGFARDTDDTSVLLRDRTNSWYHLGITGLGPDLPHCLDQMRRMTGGRQVLTVGSSMGGYAAILFGALLGADKVFAIVPQVSIDPHTTASLGDIRWRGDHERVVGDGRTLQFLLDLRGVVRLAPKTEFFVFYATDFEVDRRHAELLLGVPNVRHVTISGVGHGDAAGYTWSSGLLRDLIAGGDLSTTVARYPRAAYAPALT